MSSDGGTITAEEITPVDLLETRPGGDEPETLAGTEGDDLIDGFGGDDTITGVISSAVMVPPSEDMNSAF
jgi:Ca2+-binding RTX toxin-like protein